MSQLYDRLYQNLLKCKHKNNYQYFPKIQLIGLILHKTSSEVFFPPVNNCRQGDCTLYSCPMSAIAQEIDCNKLLQAAESLAELVCWAPTPEFLIYQVWVGHKNLHQTSLQVMLLLLIWGPHFENFYSVSKSALHYETKATKNRDCA